MKLKALRVAQLRKFQSPVAIEGFREGLNVLAGPNEFGKSTLFDALAAVFLMRFKAGGGALEKLRPYGGGDPLVEVDFVHDGVSMRLQKQFGRGATAVLTDLDHGRVIARNMDVEEQLDNGLFGELSTSAGAGLLWVAQQHGLRLPAPDIDPKTNKLTDKGEQALLRHVLQQEIEAMSRGAVFDRVLSRTTDALSELMTPTRSGVRKNSPLDLAKRQVDDLSEQLRRADEVHSAMLGKARLLEDAERELAQVSDAAALEQERAAIENLTKQLGSAQNSRDRLVNAREALELSNLKKEQAVARLTKAEENQRNDAQLRDSLQVVGELEQKIAALSAGLNNEPVTAIELEKLGQLENRLAIAEAQIEAQSAHVAVRLLPGGEGRVRLDGAPITDDRAIKISENARFEIQDVADIEIEMPGAQKAAAAKNEFAGLNEQRARLLKALNVEGLNDAKVRYEARKASETMLDELRKQLFQIAPHGTAQLAKRREELAVPTAQDLETLKAELASTEQAAANALLAANEARDLTVDDQVIAKLKLELEQKKQALEERSVRARALHVRVAGLRGEISGGNDGWRSGSVADLREELEPAARDLRRLERKRDSLMLLESLLKRAAAESRQKIALPLVQRLAPKVVQLLDAQGLDIDDELKAQHVRRSGYSEPVMSLSDGAREQLGLLIRLAIGESLREADHELPLVLDDPLAYADEQRFSVMCRLLEEAAADMQIIVFTCREQAFRELSGHRLEIQSWRPDN